MKCPEQSHLWRQEGDLLLPGKWGWKQGEREVTVTVLGFWGEGGAMKMFQNCGSSCTTS